ncbi:zinc finger protein 391-like [Armigeres subalbatus]|uniref:zinc finger protein 391-like n=1 Tax=Armigeres subalbatus TaxID=124917 RepID=UPI002ED49A98
MSEKILPSDMSEISIENIGVHEEIETCETNHQQPTSESDNSTPAVNGHQVPIDRLFDQSSPDEPSKATEGYECNVCSKRFDERRKLARHMESHSQCRLKCEQCGIFLKSRSSLNSHRQRHQQGKRFECGVCQKRFAGAKDLKTHQKVHDEQAERFTCDQCGKDFGRIYTLLDHQRLHSGKEVFSCNKCGIVFPKRRNLLLHERSHLVEEDRSKV